MATARQVGKTGKWVWQMVFDERYCTVDERTKTFDEKLVLPVLPLATSFCNHVQIAILRHLYLYSITYILYIIYLHSNTFID